jgi:asparagine synthase (glutamine-hydrolysing)
MDFIVLPDHPAGGTLAVRFAGEGARVLYHPSGRPWIVGHWNDGEVVTATAGDRSVALLGRTVVTAPALAGWLRTVRSVAELGERSLDLPGCFHLVGTFDGVTCAQGTLALAYQIFYAAVDGVTMAAGVPDRLIRATGAVLDERSLSLCLLGPYARAPWPVSERTMWHGVHKLPPGHRLLVDATGADRTNRWWYAPEPDVPLAELADQLRERLLEAVASRVDRTGSAGLSCDLSGGMDSTSLCFAAEHQGIPLTTVHMCPTDPSNPDTTWARRCQRDLPSANHVVVERGALPGYFAQPDDPVGTRLEGPTAMVHEAMIEYLVRLVAGAGSGRHMRGDGSDEIFHRTHAATAAMIRRHPVRHLRSVLRMKARNRWSVATTLRSLRDPGSYPRWLRRVAKDLTSPYDWTTRPEWDLPLRLPRWATPEAAETVRELYYEAAATGASPMIDEAGQHEVFRLVQLNGEATRQSSHIGARHGVTFEAPYVDDRVLHAGLSVRVEDRARVGVNKPVLAAAMRGVVPPDVLERRDKGDGTRGMFASMRRNRRYLEQLGRDSELARRGLVDPELLRRIASGPHLDLKAIAPLSATWAAEQWLQALPETLRAGAAQPTPQYA